MHMHMVLPGFKPHSTRSISTRLRALVLPALWNLLLRLAPAGEREQLRALRRFLKARKDQLLAGRPDDALWIDLDVPVTGGCNEVYVSPLGVMVVDMEGARMVGADGIERSLGRDGQLTLKLPGSTRIRTDRAGLLLRHSIARVNQTTSHVLKFQGGGVFSFMVDDQQTMMEVHARNIRLVTAQAGVLEVLPVQARLI